MQRGAHFAIFDVPCGAPCWAQQGRQKRYKNNAFLTIFQMKGTLGAATKCIPKSKVCKISSENECFVRLPWELFGVHLGWSIFWCAQLGCFNGAPKNFKNMIKHMVWDVLGGFFRETNLDHTDNKCVPMQRETRFSFLQSAPMQRGAHFF